MDNGGLFANIGFSSSAPSESRPLPAPALVSFE